MISENESLLILRRISCYKNMFRNYSVYLNGKKIGSVKDGEEMSLPTAIGKNSLYVKIDWFKSNVLELEVNSNDSMTIDISFKEPTIAVSLFNVLLFPVLICLGISYGGNIGACIGGGLAAGAWYILAGRPYLTRAN